jgi:uncharacterized 2Fe-2S/4Fe-4S cluster protein (DUF4445 family)
MPFAVRFLPEDRSVLLAEATELFLAAARADIWIEQPCGQKTICGKCRVRVTGAAPLPSLADARLLAGEELEDGWRLGCQLLLTGSCSVVVPAVTRAVAAKSFGDDSLFAGGFEPRLAGVLSPVGGPQRPQDASRARPPAFGVAADLGSTTVAAALISLSDGRVLATVSLLNPQVRYGGDVISRIHYAQEHARGNRALHDAATGALRDAVGQLCDQARVSGEAVVEIVAVGNATMTHAGVGEDVRPLGEAPYCGSFTESRAIAAREAGLDIAPDAAVRFLPMIRSHVGGDTVAAIVATAMDEASGWRLLVDLGTNSEVVVGCAERLVATSTAAGPAFEGANIYRGMRAAPGAIDAVRILSDGRLTVGTIASHPPIGLCGSGLVDACAELCRAGVVAGSGYMRGASELADLPATLRARAVIAPDGQRAVRLAGDVLLTAQDVRQLQLVKGSIRAGMSLLMRHCGIGPADLDEVLIAGAFGSFLRKGSALAIGLVPDIDPERVRFVGNAAGVGARMALVDRRAWDRALAVADRCEYVELAGRPDYEQAFCDAIPFPPPAPPIWSARS